MATLELSREHWLRLATSPDGERAHAGRHAVIAAIARAVPDREPAPLFETHEPLTQLLVTLIAAHRDQQRAVDRALAVDAAIAAPFLVGVTGAVAAGKSVTAVVLQAMLAAGHGLRVEVVSTDGFLFANHDLVALGLLDRKGFPESFDHAALVAFLTAVKAGDADADAPIYDHGLYDVVAGRRQRVERPDVLIVEGINVLQPPPTPGALLVSDFLDFSIYVDADEADVRAWFLRRLDVLRSQAAGDETSFFAGFASWSDDEFAAMGDAVWRTINGPNLEHHIAPSRHRADLVLVKDADHRVQRVSVRQR